jgi:signal transduction histidine kinase
MEFSLRNRIAGLYVLATALIAAVVFLLLYYVVHQTMYDHLDTELKTQSSEVFKSIVVLSNQFIFANPYEWKEGEHRQVEVNPTFLQVVDTTGKTLRKSENLLDANLSFRSENEHEIFFNTMLSGASVRQFQIPIVSTENKILGYLLIAIPLDEVEILLTKLQYLLFIAYPVVLIILFLSSRLIAGKSIAPIEKVIATAETITNENLGKKIDLPPNRDELYRLTVTINQLLGRLNDALQREKQFTSDASHELRTPLTAIKGTLEVLLRKPRTPAHYATKISATIEEVNKLSGLVDQLLQFARFENGIQPANVSSIEITAFIRSVVDGMKKELRASNATAFFSEPTPHIILADENMLRLILHNILSNAIKYSGKKPVVAISIASGDSELLVSISDNGPGIEKEHLPFIFDRFYRTDQSRNSEISGSGLGLSLAARYARLMHLSITVESEIGKGSAFTIHFPQNFF